MIYQSVHLISVSIRARARPRLPHSGWPQRTRVNWVHFSHRRADLTSLLFFLTVTSWNVLLEGMCTTDWVTFVYIADYIVSLNAKIAQNGNMIDDFPATLSKKGDFGE